jgi:cell division protease FtsH
MASVLLERETVDGEACQALLNNTWNDYLAHEASEDTKKERTKAATTTVNDVVISASVKLMIQASMSKS